MAVAVATVLSVAVAMEVPAAVAGAGAAAVAVAVTGAGAGAWGCLCAVGELSAGDEGPGLRVLWSRCPEEGNTISLPDCKNPRQP